jgi:predicted acylesterase/phospholipase RssA
MDKTSFFKSCLGVFQGGGCRAAAFAGAYEEAIRRGVSFTEVAGTSAGSIVAALIGAGATHSFVRSKLEKLDFSIFLEKPERTAKRALYSPARYSTYADLYYDQGFHSSLPIKEWMEALLRELLPTESQPITFRSLPFPTYIVSTDLKRAEAKVWSQDTTPNELVSDAVRASCSIPFHFQPIDKRYVDGGLLSNLPAHVFAIHGAARRSLTSNILAFSLHSETEPPGDWTTKTFLFQLANALVDGSTRLQLELQPSVNVVKINTGNIRATDFDKMTGEVTQTLIKSGAEATKTFFDQERMHIRRPTHRTGVCSDVDEFYARITETLSYPMERLIIAEHNTDWVYKLFPTIFTLRERGVRIDAILPQNGDRPGDGAYRRRLLDGLGANLTILTGESFVPLRATIVVPNDKSQLRALVGVDQQPKIQANAVSYDGYLDAGVVKTVFEKLSSLVAPADAGTIPQLERTPHEEVIGLLRKVGQYSTLGVSISIEQVKLSDLVATSRFTREFKYNQIRHLADSYRRQGLDLFEPIAVKLARGLKSVVTPPVVEEAGGKYILIEGSTRATFCRDEGISSFMCVVVRGVSAPLPSRTYELNRVRITARDLPPSERYEGFEYAHFRHIERAMHSIDGPGS